MDKQAAWPVLLQSKELKSSSGGNSVDIHSHLIKIREKIEQACAKSGRSPHEVTVVAVTKYIGAEQMEAVFEAGLEHIGENRIQDALPKWERFGGKGIWHFIGHLQTNKVKYVLGKFQYIHSLDRLSLAKEIEKRAAPLGLHVPCFVQVNVSGERTKYGLSPDELEPFIEQLQDFPHIKAVGLMTMAPYEDDPERTRPVFHQLKALQVKLQEKKFPHAPLTELSMGMSNDYPIAVEEGATYVRLGSCLIGR
jgi:hypothetical protein